MSEIKELTSLQNPRVKEVVKLRDRRYRDESQKYIIEGYREIERALRGEVPFLVFFYSKELFLGSNEMSLIAKMRANRVEILEVSTAVFAKLSYRDRPDGLLGVARQTHLSLADIDHKFKIGQSPFFLIAEAIEKPGNLGSILRSSDAAGIDAFFVCDRCTDIYNPNVVRSSVGTLFSVPIIEATSEEAIRWLKEKGIKIVAATPEAEDEFTKADLKGPIAIVVGTEQLGLSQKWKEAATVQVKIPMKGIADSLNVAAATTLLLYEILRQREVE